MAALCVPTRVRRTDARQGRAGRLADQALLSLRNAGEAENRYQFTHNALLALVKDVPGISFSNYCEKLRITNACELLREGKQIQTVAEEGGYSSAHTFRRVFKKVVGVLPSQYS